MAPVWRWNDVSDASATAPDGERIERIEKEKEGRPLDLIKSK